MWINNCIENLAGSFIPTEDYTGAAKEWFDNVDYCRSQENKSPDIINNIKIKHIMDNFLRCFQL